MLLPPGSCLSKEQNSIPFTRQIGKPGPWRNGGLETSTALDSYCSAVSGWLHAAATPASFFQAWGVLEEREGNVATASYTSAA